MTAKEKMFCIFYVYNGNLKEAAVNAGYSQPEKDGSMLLFRDDINNEIERLFNYKIKNLKRKACAGYERLAFGSIADAVKLMFSDEPLNEKLKTYDLYNISEIKRLKEGAMEIKFFDRIKALEKLEMAENNEQKTGSDFYNALVGGLKNEQYNESSETGD